MGVASIIQTSINWWDLVPAVVGGIIGAFAGGIPAYFLSKSASKEVTTRDKQARETRDRLDVLRLYLALTRTANDIFSTRTLIDEMMARPVAEGDKFPNQRRLSIISGIQNSAINPFWDLDLSPITSANGIDLINQIDLLGRCYVAQIAILEDFRVLKKSLFDLYEQAHVADTNDPDVVKFTLDRAQFGTKIEVREMAAETVATGIIETVQRNSELAFQACNAYNHASSTYVADLTLPQILLDKAAERFPDLLQLSGA